MPGRFDFFIDDDFFSEEVFTNPDWPNMKRQLFKLLEVPKSLKAPIYYNPQAYNEIKEKLLVLNDCFNQGAFDFLHLLLENTRPIKENEDRFVFEVFYNKNQSSIEFKGCFPISIDRKPVLLSKQKQGKWDNLILLSDNNFVEKLSLAVVRDDKELWIYINKILSPNYHFSKKHGDCNNTAIDPSSSKKASQLLTCENETIELLQESIFDLRDTSKEKNYWRYNFDYKNETFIIFPNEGDNPQNCFHAYHLNKSSWGELPQSILKFFGKH